MCLPCKSQFIHASLLLCNDNFCEKVKINKFLRNNTFLLAEVHILISCTITRKIFLSSLDIFLHFPFLNEKKTFSVTLFSDGHLTNLRMSDRAKKHVISIDRNSRKKWATSLINCAISLDPVDTDTLRKMIYIIYVSADTKPEYGGCYYGQSPDDFTLCFLQKFQCLDKEWSEKGPKNVVNGF